MSHSGESAAVHYAQTGFLGLGDEVRMGDDDPAVVRTVGRLSVAGNDTSAARQEKEAKSVGGVPFL